MKKFLVSSSVIFAAALYLATPLVVEARIDNLPVVSGSDKPVAPAEPLKKATAGESAIVKYDSSEVKLKSAADCNNEFKFTFIKKLDTLSKGSGISAKRFERLKNEINKLRERTHERIERINAQIEKLNEEKKALSCLLKELDSTEITFNKVKILPDENAAKTGANKK